MSHDDSELAQRFLEKNIAGGLALSVLAILTDAANDISQYLTSGEADTAGILSVINDVLADMQTGATNFQNLTANFNALCEAMKE